MNQEYQYPIPKNAGIRHRGTVGGSLVTSTANQRIEILDDAGVPVIANALKIDNAGLVNMTVRINDEKTTHLLKAGQSLDLSGIQVNSFLVVESGSTVTYAGGMY